MAQHNANHTETTEQTAGAYQSANTVSGAKKAKKKKNRSVGWTIAFVLCLLVFIGAAFFGGRILYSYWHGSVEYQELANEVLEIAPEEEVQTLADMTVDWDALMAQNSDTVAWMYVPGTVINYPVVWCGNDYTYLTKPFSGERSAVDYGALFLEGENAPDFSDAHNIIFGHAMKNGTMFGAFYRMSWNGTFNENRDIYILTPQGNLHLRTFAYVWVPATELEVLTTNFVTDAARTSFLQDKLNRTRFTVDDEIPSVADMTTTFSFITCDSAAGTGRYVVYAYVFESTIDGIEGLGKLDPNAIGETVPELVDGLGW